MSKIFVFDLNSTYNNPNLHSTITGISTLNNYKETFGYGKFFTGVPLQDIRLVNKSDLHEINNEKIYSILLYHTGQYEGNNSEMTLHNDYEMVTTSGDNFVYLRKKNSVNFTTTGTHNLPSNVSNDIISGTTHGFKNIRIYIKASQSPVGEKYNVIEEIKIYEMEDDYENKSSEKFLKEILVWTDVSLESNWDQTNSKLNMYHIYSRSDTLYHHVTNHDGAIYFAEDSNDISYAYPTAASNGNAISKSLSDISNILLVSNNLVTTKDIDIAFTPPPTGWLQIGNSIERFEGPNIYRASWDNYNDYIYTSYSVDFYNNSFDINYDGTKIIIGIDVSGNYESNVHYRPQGFARVFEYKNNNWVQMGNDIHPNITSTSQSSKVEFGLYVKISPNGESIAIAGKDHSDSTKLYKWNNTANDWDEKSITPKNTIGGMGFDYTGNIFVLAKNTYIAKYTYDGTSWSRTANISTTDSSWSHGVAREAGSVNVSHDGNIIFVVFRGQHNVQKHYLFGEQWKARGVVLDSSLNVVSSTVINSNGNTNKHRPGFSVGMNSAGTRVVISNQFNQGDNLVTIYDITTSFTDIKKFTKEDLNSSTSYGASVDMSSDGNRIIIGSRKDISNNKDYLGSVSIFDYSNNSWNLVGEKMYGDISLNNTTWGNTDRNGGYNFGEIVKISGDGTTILGSSKHSDYLWGVHSSLSPPDDLEGNTHLNGIIKAYRFLGGDTISIDDYNQNEINTFLTDISNNIHTYDSMGYLAYKIIKASPEKKELVINSLYNTLNIANQTFTFNNLVDTTALTIFDASNNADISGGNTTPTTIEKEIFKAAKTLSFRKLRKDLKSNELETKIKDISTVDVDANITTYINNINQNLSLNLSGFDLSGLDLTETDLSGANLVSTDLSGVDLSGANLSNSDISSANITNTALKYTTLTNVNTNKATGSPASFPDLYRFLNSVLYHPSHLTGANLSNIDLKSVSFINDDLSGVNFSGSDLSGVDFTGATLDYINLSSADITNANLENIVATYANFRDTSANNVDLSGATLTHADFTNSKLSNSILKYIDASGATFTNSTLSGANLSIANIVNAVMRNIIAPNAVFTDVSANNIDLSGSTLTGANFTNAKASNGVFNNIDASGIIFTNGTFTNANFTDATMKNTNMVDTDMSGSVFINTDLSGSNLTNAILQGINLSGTNLDNVNLQNTTITQSFNSDKSTGTAINIPYTLRYENFDDQDKLYQTSTNLSTGSYTVPGGTAGPFKDGDTIAINGIEIVFNNGISEAGIFGINKDADGGAFSFLQENSNIVGWGNIYKGGNIPSDISNVISIFSTKTSKAAVCENGKVFTWGIAGEGGSGPNDLSGVIDIRSNEKAFCALLYNGTITCWGDSATGGTTPADISNVVQIYSNKNAFTALSANGSVKSWGAVTGSVPTQDNFVDVYSTNTAFAGLKADGTVSCWGSSDATQNNVSTDVSNVSIIYSNDSAFVAHIDNNTIMCWGDTNSGGTTPTDISNVDTVFNTNTAFSALLNSGDIVSWGNAANGGTNPTDISNVESIASTEKAFTAITKNGSLVAWGDNNYGGNNLDVSMCENKYKIFSTDRAFAAVSKYGDINVWGDNNYGGNQADISGHDEIIHVFSTSKAFMALKKDKTQIIWGDNNFGGFGGPSYNINISHNIQDTNMYLQSYAKSNVRNIYNIHYDTRKFILDSYTSNAESFALLNTDGTVTTKGSVAYGGDTTAVAGSLTNVKEIIPGNEIMTVLKSNGTLVSWGDLSNNTTSFNNVKKVVNDSNGLTIILKANGDVSANHISLSSWDLCGNVPSNNLSNLDGIIDIYPSNKCFAALRYDNSLYLWGQKDNSTTRPLHNIMREASKLTSNIKEVMINGSVMVALKYDGTVVTTGDVRYGGDISNNDARYKLYGGTADNITEVFLNDKFAVALKNDNSCIYWGDISRNSTLFNYDISTFTDIKSIAFSKDVIVGLTYEGSVVGLGEKTKGAEIHLPKDVQKIYATTNNGFTALKNDGTITSWGDPAYGGEL
jgi:uncharacterized protein YjbI with pentapeptide repeats